MGKRKTEDDYRNLGAKLGIEYVGPIPRGIVKKAKWRCLVCQQIFEIPYRDAEAYDISSCRPCARQRHADRQRLTRSDYDKVGKDRGISLDQRKTPKTANEKANWKCSCGYKWSTTYGSINAGTGCPKCAGKAPKTKKDYNELAASIGYKFTGHTPKDVFGKTSWKCKRNHTWKASYDAIRSGNRCPKCNDPSKGEQIVSIFLSTSRVRFETQKTFSGCKDKSLLKFDFYLPKHNLLIEYNGEQHYKAVKFFGGRTQLRDQQRRDKIKSDWAAANGITLLVIPYTEFDRIEEILSQYI